MASHDAADRSSPFKPGFRTPAKTSEIGMLLFLAALFMLFAAAMLGYVMVRFSVTQSHGLPVGDLHVPRALWLSTAIVVAASFTIQAAVREIRRERQPAFRRWLGITLALAIAFVLVQAPSMSVLLLEHRAARHQKIALYGFVFFLILLHALHVLGGIVALISTTNHARKGVYDHEHFQPVRHMALYWHFLDAVWLVMFFTFLLMR